MFCIYSVERSLLFSGSPIEQFNPNLITCQVFRDNLDAFYYFGRCPQGNRFKNGI